VSPAVDALRQRFRARCGADRATLAGAVAAGDIAAVRMIAHRLAGAAGTFGFGPLSQAALLLEDQIAFGDPADPELVAVVDGLLATVSDGACA
jgi:HPt (histidine-containing phosphotransfer) domain-containing protein